MAATVDFPHCRVQFQNSSLSSALQHLGLTRVGFETQLVAGKLHCAYGASRFVRTRGGELLEALPIKRFHTT